jgi:hypothetical protein
MVARRDNAGGGVHNTRALHARDGGWLAARREWAHRRRRLQLFGLSRDPAIGGGNCQMGWLDQFLAKGGMEE